MKTPFIRVLEQPIIQSSHYLRIISILLALSILLIFWGCEQSGTESEDLLKVKPVVKKTSANYVADNFMSAVDDSTYLRNLNNYYSNNFSEDLRAKVLDYMKIEADKLGENPGILDSILTKTGCGQTGEYVLPAYAERARFEGKEAWIFRVTYGLGYPSFGHFKQFAFGLPDLDTLYYTGCR